MFGHLKPEDFVNLMEGAEPSTRHKAHLEACARCRATQESLGLVHSEMTSLDGDIPEPNWTDFRTSVRDQLLSRSIQRESVVRRWTGWAVRPAAAWALSVLLAVGVTAAAFLWSLPEMPQPASVAALPEESVIPTEFLDAETYPALYSQTDLFEELVQLGDKEQEELQRMLESAQQ